MKTILVTGGLGYIGSHTVIKLIENGYDVIIIDNLSKSTMSTLYRIEEITGVRPPVYTYDCVYDRQLVVTLFCDHPGIDTVIHFAGYKCVAESVQHPMTYYKNNIGALCQILDLAYTYGVKHFIFSSSCTVYGQPIKELLPITEETQTTFTNCPYGNTKLFGEQIIKDFCNAHPIKAVILRYFNPIGAHPSALIGETPIDKPNNLLPYITSTAKGKYSKLEIFGNDYTTPDGTCLRDYIDINDLADGHIKAIEYAANMNLKYDIFNLGTGKPVSVFDIVSTFEKVNNVKVKYEFVDRRPGDVESIWADCSKANKLLGWYATTPLENSLRTAWEWEKKL